LLIGLKVNITDLISLWQPVLWAIVAVLVSRTVVIYGLSWLMQRVTEPPPMSWQHVLNWGGLRGAICLALALSLPASMGSDRELIRVMAFGVVLFTLLVQSTTMRPILRWLHINVRSEVQVEYEMRHARLTALRSADHRIDRLHGDGLLSTHTWERLKVFVVGQASTLAASVREMLVSDPALEAEELDTGWRELMRAQRGALLGLRRDGVISEEVFEKLTSETDAHLSEGFQAVPTDKENITGFMEVTIPTGARSVGKTIAELALPRSAVLVSVRRGSEIIIPRGDTSFRSGDVVTALCENDVINQLRELLTTPGAKTMID
jgi:CPA1 family monovalent cation:H+ antiporter